VALEEPRDHARRQPHSAIDSISPNTSTIRMLARAPATASTLSSDMVTSAMTICQARCGERLARGAAE